MKKFPYQRPRLTDLIEGYYVTRIVDTLHQQGVLQALADQQDIGSIARERGWEAPLLKDLLEYVALRSDIVDACAGKQEMSFRVSAAYVQTSLPAHLLDQYIGAYGPCLDNLEAVLRESGRGGSLVDRKRHAVAFSHADGGANHFEIAKIVQELEITNLLDLGCGGAAMLTDIGQRVTRFSGIGVDANPEMVTMAQGRVVKVRLAGRIQIVHGDVFQLANITSPAAREKIQAITAMSVANEFFAGRGKPGIGKFLAVLRKLFPRRILIVRDYYGCLGRKQQRSASYQRSLLHDVAQLVSGQGIPPRNRDQWREIYKRASCTLIKEFEGESDGIARFVHLVQL